MRLVPTVIHFISFNIRENRQYKHSKNIDCGTTRQNDCTYGSPLKHTNTKIAMSITQARISCAADSSETSQAQMTRVKITFVSTVYIARAACWLLSIVNFGATPCAVRYRREISHSAERSHVGDIAKTESPLRQIYQPLSIHRVTVAVSMPSGFRRHLVGKTLINSVFHGDIDSDHTVIFINQRIECNLNNTINLRPSTQHIMPCYTHKMAIVS